MSDTTYSDRVWVNTGPDTCQCKTCGAQVRVMQAHDCPNTFGGSDPVETFDPEVWHTWPIPTDSIIGHKISGVPRLDSYGEGWCDGFDLALQMADHFQKTGDWVVPGRPSDLLGGKSA